MTNDSNLFHLVRDGLPARLDAGQTARLLGIAPHDVPVLTGTGLLKPLGSPVPNAPKYFALVDVLEHATDRDWLNRATQTLAKHWRLKNDAQCAKKSEQDREWLHQATKTVARHRQRKNDVQRAKRAGQEMSVKLSATGG